LTTQAKVFIERLWRSLKYELIYPGDFATGLELFPGLENWGEPLIRGRTESQ
jgi:hypothetical protein